MLHHQRSKYPNLPECLINLDLWIQNSSISTTRLPFPVLHSAILNLTTFVLAFTRFFTPAGQLALCVPTLPGNGQRQEVVSAVDKWVCTIGASNPNNVRGAVQWRRFIFPAIHAISHAPLLCSFWHARILKAATRTQHAMRMPAGLQPAGCFHTACGTIRACLSTDNFWNVIYCCLGRYSFYVKCSLVSSTYQSEVGVQGLPTPKCNGLKCFKQVPGFVMKDNVIVESP
jgi:hypothetical protein